MDEPRKILTGLEYNTEQDAWDAFDDAMRLCQGFTVYREVSGEIMQPRPGAADQTVRIDRILVPTKAAVDAGWKAGVIGVECKRSNVKVGRVISQCLDYSRSAFDIRDGILVVPRWIFIYPLDRVIGDLESVMAQNRIGYVWTSTYRPLIFGTGGMNLIGIARDGTLECKQPPMGNKTGNRG